MKHPLWLVMLLLAFVPALAAQPQFRNAGATLVAETSPNNAVESGENVTVRLALKNVGDAVASNLVATLQTGDGVSNAVPQIRSYGTLQPCGASVARDFSFKCMAPSNSLLLVKLDLEDSGRSFDTVTFRFRIGPQVAYASTPLSFAINDVGPAEMFPSILTITNAPGTIVNVSCTLSNLSHMYPDDLDILLVSPGGDTVLLMSDACGDVELDHVTLSFTDDADASLPDRGLPNPRVVRPSNYEVSDMFPPPAPEGPYAGVMSAFNGKEANGDWHLYILDDSEGDAGMLFGGWSLALTTVLQVDAAPTLRIIGLTNNAIRFSVSGRVGYPYAIETAPDPVQSFQLESFTMPHTGTRIFEYPISSENRFFRAVTNP